MRMKGTQSASRVAHAVPNQVRGDWYAEVRAKRLRGPDTSACALIFGYRDEQHWYAIRIRNDTVEATRFKDVAPSRLLFSSTVVGLDSSQWNRIGLLVSNNRMNFFVNDDRLPYDLDLADVSDFIPDGTVDAGVISANTLYSESDIRCAFDDLLVREA
jgi:hypothetical protein